MKGTMTEAVHDTLSEKIGPVLEPQFMALVAAIGRSTAIILQELSVMAKGFAEDGMTLADFADVLSGELEKGVESVADTESSDDGDS